MQLPKAVLAGIARHLKPVDWSALARTCPSILLAMLEASSSLVPLTPALNIRLAYLSVRSRPRLDEALGPCTFFSIDFRQLPHHEVPEFLLSRLRSVTSRVPSISGAGPEERMHAEWELDELVGSTLAGVNLDTLVLAVVPPGGASSFPQDSAGRGPWPGSPLRVRDLTLFAEPGASSVRMGVGLDLRLDRLQGLERLDLQDIWWEHPGVQKRLPLLTCLTSLGLLCGPGNEDEGCVEFELRLPEDMAGRLRRLELLIWDSDSGAMPVALGPIAALQRLTGLEIHGVRAAELPRLQALTR